ncbi:hypothetical protein [Zeaxanthinibacter enoshimensis]|uniref:Uncharacterized protein n=1 Tax=Zeaxanthinibacter enoshimensis TaxID=392009 RepID=A0A4R6TQC8_9FLAO|nr:hypothetical protein [Zeaxanthinibacter enoshimensis]TDQ33390.1 hypothetical protein CLV82_1229 [Zeaxanthinibacter enoshimensis]
MKKKTKNELKIIILTAIITSILTVLGSYFLMYSQLSYEQDYWKERIKTEKLIELVDKQTILMNEINEGILTNQTLVKHYKLLSAKYMSKLSLSYNRGKGLTEDFQQNFENKSLELHKQIMTLASKIQESELYFQGEVDSLLNPLSEALNKNYQTNLFTGSDIHNQDINSIEMYFDRDFETLKVLKEKRMELIKAMRDEIGENSKFIYEKKLK